MSCTKGLEHRTRSRIYVQDLRSGGRVGEGPMEDDLKTTRRLFERGAGASMVMSNTSVE